MRLTKHGKCKSKWLQLRFNIPNIPENKRIVERMLKQSLEAFKLFQHRFKILSTRFNNVERGWQTHSTLPFNKIERMLNQMLKPFARALHTRMELSKMPRGAVSSAHSSCVCAAQSSWEIHLAKRRRQYQTCFILWSIPSEAGFLPRFFLTAEQTAARCSVLSSFLVSTLLQQIAQERPNFLRDKKKTSETR